MEVQQNLGEMPDRPILDFLVRYFVAEVNWMDQMVYPPWFLEQYQLWWTAKRPSVFGIEFATLLLRMCSYATQFLPCPSYCIERIRGMSLADIRSACDDVADNLAVTCTHLNPKGSLLRVQHLVFAGLKSRCEGRTNDFRNALGTAIQVAQKIGLDKDATQWVPDMNELEKETRRRIFCNLYIWDSVLSRQLDRIAILHGGLSPENMPRMRLGPDIDDTHTLEGFTERILQARLANFWKKTGPKLGSEYDIVLAEERYEMLCSDFLATLPSAFALQPDKQWDERLPMLPHQRELLHISLFESICCNFRPALLQEPTQVQELPKYKQVLLSSQRKALAVAALYVLRGASTLHALMGGSQTRFTGIILPTFEAAALLVYLCMDRTFCGEDEPHRASMNNSDPLGAGIVSSKREECMQAVRDALNRLQMLAEVSHMAEVGAQTLAQLLRKMAKGPRKPQKRTKPSPPPPEGPAQAAEIPNDMPMSEYPDPDPVTLAELMTSVPAFNVDDMNWEAISSGL
ncbi:hypothetical protein NUU61_005736 [Penicillium alfredii]|uniref:Xylanolytic transcriptional activator regulatory domain-containing protein n=1 Tax=Penicillium alfredii TaxID=1506179 RepID=A0A9W9F9Y9_9EURO|nr:uncharacterized protein NUU61_005736 [Penicillium alfredii]KAJ5096380.1 hypothetical protein NUU61_005736 [Penicillium alfredii]